MTELKILVVTHKEAEMPSDKSLYYPIQVGEGDQLNENYLRDNTDQQIAALNPYYSELTALYWEWKNLEADYLGLMHYRRVFARKYFPFVDKQPLNQIVRTAQQFLDDLSQVDIVVPKRRNYWIENLYSHYTHTLDDTHLEKVRMIIGELCPRYLVAFQQTIDQTWGYMFNMFVMPKHLLNQYCEWLFPILAVLYQEVDASQYSDFEKRYIGRVSEILFNVWLNYHQYSVKEVPIAYLGEVNYIKKAIGFLQAKFFGKKYHQSF